MIPTCALHHKPMKMGRGGSYFCATPIQKSPDGKTVLKWCDYTDDQEELVSETISLSTPPAKIALDSKNTISEDPKARGMVRHGVSCAFITKLKDPRLTPQLISWMEDYVEYIMEGPIKISQTLKERAEIEKSEKELDEIFNKP